MSPLLQENGKMPVAYVGGANSLSWSFIGIPRKPSYSASFSPLILLLHYSFLISLYICNEISFFLGCLLCLPFELPWFHGG